MWLLFDHRSVDGLPLPNMPHLSTSEYAAYRSTSLCQPSTCICIARMLIPPGLLSLAEFTYRWKIVKDGQFLHEPSLRETTKRWMAQHLSIDGEVVDWVMEPKGVIRKDNLTFTAKFL